MKQTFEQWCIQKHAETNHMYDKYLPYEFHLRMVHTVGMQFEHLLPSTYFRDDAINSLWGHDLIEDTRVNYNEILKLWGKYIADIIYALTNEKGKNRVERANDAYYKLIMETEGAVFAKLCDRIANVQYSKMTRSSMFKKYKDENEHFMNSLGYFNGQGSGINPYHSMFVYLEELFTSPMPIK